jgi:hypothetical protein
MNYKALEILTEEPSMEYFLRGLLPRILPKEYVLDENCFIRPHEGKSHLQKSIPIKMRAYARYPYPVKVLIVHDQDSNDCKVLKNKLIELAGVSKIPCLVRIACRELENWYIGDFEAVEKIYPEIRAEQQFKKAKFKDSDSVFGAHEIGLLTKNFGKIHAARLLGEIINIQANTSPSFQQFISGLSKLLIN